MRSRNTRNGTLAWLNATSVTQPPAEKGPDPLKMLKSALTELRLAEQMRYLESRDARFATARSRTLRSSRSSSRV